MPTSTFLYWITWLYVIKSCPRPRHGRVQNQQTAKLFSLGMYKSDNLNFKNKMVKLTVSKSEPTKSKVVKSTMVLTSHDTLPKPTNLDRLEMTTCWKSGKHPGNDLKISIPGTTSHATIQLPPLQVVTAYLSVEGDLCGQYSVCLEPLPGLKELCSRMPMGTKNCLRMFQEPI